MSEEVAIWLIERVMIMQTIRPTCTRVLKMKMKKQKTHKHKQAKHITGSKSIFQVLFVFIMLSHVRWDRWSDLYFSRCWIRCRVELILGMVTMNWRRTRGDVVRYHWVGLEGLRGRSAPPFRWDEWLTSWRWWRGRVHVRELSTRSTRTMHRYGTRRNILFICGWSMFNFRSVATTACMPDAACLFYVLIIRNGVWVKCHCFINESFLSPSSYEESRGKSN